jgi:translation initiation factor IF-2
LSTEIQINIIHKGVGAITETDVMLASASDAIIIGFNVPAGNARQLADKEN